MRKKLLSILISITVIISAMAAIGFAVYGDELTSLLDVSILSEETLVDDAVCSCGWTERLGEDAYTVEADENVLTAVCAKCNKPLAKLELVVHDAIENGTPCEATIDPAQAETWSKLIGEVPTVVYSISEHVELSSAPLYAGLYKASITYMPNNYTYEGITAYDYFTITTASGQGDEMVKVEKVYGDLQFDGRNCFGTALPKDTVFTSDNPSVVEVRDYNKLWINSVGAAVVSADVNGASKQIAVVVKPRELTLKANNAEKNVGESDPQLSYSIVKGELVHADELEGIFVGRVGGEKAGVYDINILQKVGRNDNYKITFEKGRFTIHAQKISILVDNVSKVYGNPDPKLTASVFINHERVFKDMSDVFTLEREPGEDKGTYEIRVVPGVNFDNNEPSVVNGYLTVLQRQITVKADVVTKGLGDKDPELTYTVTSGGLVGDDELEGVVLKRNIGESTGMYTVYASHNGFEDKNYNITLYNGQLVVKPIHLDLVADDKQITYGDEDVELTWHVRDNTVDPKELKGISIKRVQGSDAGHYRIELSQKPDTNKKYDIDMFDGTYTIAKKPVTITPDPVVKKAGAKLVDPSQLTYTVSGLLNDDQLTREPVMEYAADLNTAVPGNYAIYASGAEAGDNYEINYAEGKYMVYLDDKIAKGKVLLAKGVSTGLRSIKLSWNQMGEGAKYTIYGTACGGAYKKIATTSKLEYKVKKVKGKKLKAHQTYKFYVVAKNDGKTIKSKKIHLIAGAINGKFGNTKTVRVTKSSYNLEVGDKAKIKSKYTILNGLKHIDKAHGNHLRYVSNCPKVAMVSENGTILARSEGTAIIYVQDITGLWTNVRVMVTEPESDTFF